MNGEMVEHMNMKTSCSLVGLIVTSSLVVACSRPSSTLTSPSSTPPPPSSSVTADQLAGTWHLISIRAADGAEQATPAGAAYTLTLAEGRLSTRADCNLCAGTFVLSGQTMTAGPALACTRAACSTMAFENAYTTLLAGDNTVAVSGNSLTLSSSRGVLRLSR